MGMRLRADNTIKLEDITGLKRLNLRADQVGKVNSEDLDGADANILQATRILLSRVLPLVNKLMNEKDPRAIIIGLAILNGLFFVPNYKFAFAAYQRKNRERPAASSALLSLPLPEGILFYSEE